jgi:hypothetical protein
MIDDTMLSEELKNTRRELDDCIESFELMKERNALRGMWILILSILLTATMIFGISIGNTVKDRHTHLESREETLWLHSNISTDSLLVWSKDSSEVYK